MKGGGEPDAVQTRGHGATKTALEADGPGAPLQVGSLRRKGADFPVTCGGRRRRGRGVVEEGRGLHVG